MSLTIKPVPLLEEITYLWWIEQLSDIISIHPYNGINGLYEQEIYIKNSLKNNQIYKIIAISHIVYDNKIIIRRGEFIRYYANLQQWGQDPFKKGNFNIVIDVRERSMLGKDFNSTLLNPFKIAMVISKL